MPLAARSRASKADCDCKDPPAHNRLRNPPVTPHQYNCIRYSLSPHPTSRFFHTRPNALPPSPHPPTHPRGYILASFPPAVRGRSVQLFRDMQGETDVEFDPSDYMKSSGELLGLTVLQAWIICAIWAPEQFRDNKLKGLFG